MGKQRRKYSKELKIELVEKVLAGRSTLEVAKDEGISPDLVRQVEKAVHGRKVSWYIGQ